MGLFGRSYSSIVAEYARLVSQNIPDDERKLNPKVLMNLSSGDEKAHRAKWKETMQHWKSDLIHLRDACTDYADKSLFRADEERKISEIITFCIDRTRVLNAALQQY